MKYFVSVEVVDTLQSLAIYNYAKTMGATAFKFYLQYHRGILS